MSSHPRGVPNGVILYQSLLHRIAYDNGNMKIMAMKGLNVMVMSK
jgi:hypothetical protein